MTPEERAEDVVRTWLTGCHLGERRLSDVCEAVTDAIFKAVAAERDRCVELVGAVVRDLYLAAADAETQGDALRRTVERDGALLALAALLGE